MIAREKSRKEIEARFNQMGDYVKIGYLTSCLKNNLDFDTRKFVLVKLAELLENKKMFLDAGRMMKSVAEINTIFQGKVDDFVKSAELFVKGGNFDSANAAIRDAVSASNEKQKSAIRTKAREIYKMQANTLLAQNKRSRAVKIYEEMLATELDINERNDIQKSLLNLYESLGMIKEYNLLRKRINN